VSRGAGGRARLAGLRAALAADAFKRRQERRPDESQVVEEGPVFDGAETDTDVKSEKSEGRWAVFGKVSVAILGIGMTLVGLTLTYADSHLELVDGRAPEFHGYTSKGTSFTFVCVLHSSFTNSGLRSDYVDHIDIHPANLDETIRSEPKFTDRTPIAWRETKALRFEVVVTTSLTTYDWKNFLVTFYDSKGRQVAQVPFTTRFLRPDDIRPKVRQMLTLTDGVSDSAPPPRKPLPTLVAAWLSVSLPKAHQDPHRLLFAQLISSGEVVGKTNADGERERNGHFDAKLKIISRVDRSAALAYAIRMNPSPGPGFRFPITWTRVWSDGTRDNLSVEFGPLPDKPTASDLPTH
jgi:hypothetical protein